MVKKTVKKVSKKPVKKVGKIGKGILSSCFGKRTKIHPKFKKHMREYSRASQHIDTMNEAERQALFKKVRGRRGAIVRKSRTKVELPKGLAKFRQKS